MLLVGMNGDVFVVTMLFFVFSSLLWFLQDAEYGPLCFMLLRCRTVWCMDCFFMGNSPVWVLKPTFYPLRLRLKYEMI